MAALEENSEPLENASSAIVADLVRLRLPFHDLVRSQLVSKEWQTWCSANAALLWKAHREWYFPTGRRNSAQGTWVGLHHPSNQEHRLPDLDFLRAVKIKFLTGASGLLLLRIEKEPALAAKVVACTPNHGTQHLPPSLGLKVVVCNPLTRKWRELPSINREQLHMERSCRCAIPYQGDDTVLHMMVDGVSNTYEILLTNKSFICAFNSQTNEWKCISPALIPNPVNFSVGSLYSNGRIYSVESTGPIGAQHFTARARLVASRRWLPDVYTLYDEITMKDPMFVKGRLCAPTLVACLDDVYAIMPVLSRIPGGSWPSRSIRRFRHGSSSLPVSVSFELLKLKEEERKFEPCCAPTILRVTFTDLLTFADRPWKSFRCAVKGSVIWLAFRDKLLQFDVVSRCSQTQANLGAFEARGGYPMPYEPSFLVNP